MVITDMIETIFFFLKMHELYLDTKSKQNQKNGFNHINLSIVICLGMISGKLLRRNASFIAFHKSNGIYEFSRVCL